MDLGDEAEDSGENRRVCTNHRREDYEETVTVIDQACLLQRPEVLWEGPSSRMTPFGVFQTKQLAETRTGRLQK